MKHRMRAMMMSLSLISLCMGLIIFETYSLFSSDITINSHLVAGNLNLRLDRVGLKVSELDESGYLVQSDYGSYNTNNTTYNNKSVEHHYSKNDGEDVFMCSDNSLIVPGAYREVEMEISHENYNVGEQLTLEEYKAKYGKNSTVAFDYWFEIRLNSNSNTDNWKELAKQLTVSVQLSNDNGATWEDVKKFTAYSSSNSENKNNVHLYDIDDQVSLFVGDAENYIGTIGVGGSQRFRVRLSFDNLNYEYNPETGVLVSDNNVAQNGEVYFDFFVHAVQKVNTND